MHLTFQQQQVYDLLGDGTYHCSNEINKLMRDYRKRLSELNDMGIAIHGDYFELSSKIPRHVLCTASNPSFTFGGGIDRFFYEKYPHYCEIKQLKGGGNERIGNICFTISVSNAIKSNEGLVRDAIRFALDNTHKGETLILSGLGTSIGLLNEDIFVDILASEVESKII